MIRLALSVVLGLALAACFPANAADVAGTWSGAWAKNGDPLPVTMRFERAGAVYQGSFDSDALQVAGIPFAAISVGGNHVQFELKGDTSTSVFDGYVEGKIVQGTFVEGSARGTFRLERMPRPTAGPTTRDVVFRNGDVILGGTVLLPQGQGRHPAIIFLHGSGAEGRYANRWLAQAFAKAGFVSLIYDKRGVGQSTGNWKTSGFEDLANDAAQGIRFLASLPEVNPAKIGIYGHSQGGTLAPLAAVRAPRIGFVIASSAAGGDPAETEEYSIGNSLGIAALPPREAADARAFAHAIVEVAYRGAPRSSLDAFAAKLKGRSWYFDPPPPDDFYWSFSRRIADFRPQEYWRRVKAPVLLLFGERDERVPAQSSSNSIVKALHGGGNHDVTVRMFSGADHTFLLTEQKGGWPKHVPDYAGIIVDWALNRVREGSTHNP